MVQFEDKKQILEENYNSYLKNTTEEGKKVSFAEWVELESESDPGFFQWFFGPDADLKNDFDMSLTDQQRREFRDFLNSLNPPTLERTTSVPPTCD